MDCKNYLIMVGAPKCGTTSLSSWLGNQSYAVLAKQKETLYFTDFTRRRWRGPGAGFADGAPTCPASFAAEFSAKPDASLRIEASTDNLSCPVAADNIARFAERPDVGDVWIVALLRDPIQRIISEFEHTLRLGWQRGSLLQSLKAERERTARGWHPLFRHVERSRYATQLARYRKLFGKRLLTLDFHRIGEAGERNRLLRWMGRIEDVGGQELEHQNKRSVVARPGTTGLLENRGLLAFGRALVPKRIRPMVRNWVSGGAVERYVPNDKEVDFICDALTDEIDAFVEAPDIPTERWDMITTERA